LVTICSRVENIDKKFDIVTSRAVSSLKNISEYALPKLKKNGYFVAYKSRKAPEEIEEAKPVLKKYSSEIVDILEYDLPLEENHTRNLIIIQKHL
jgi:16S rRNA (guanine527-N7)-methyltransferase